MQTIKELNQELTEAYQTINDLQKKAKGPEKAPPLPETNRNRLAAKNSPPKEGK
jgi:uncharacterized coiled-coil protein SlyX